MKKILFVSYFFPPSGGPGVHRSLGFIENLADNGYTAEVLTVKESTFNNPFEYKQDKSLSRRVPSPVNVHRTPSLEPVKLKLFLVKLRIFRLFWFFLFPLFWERQALWFISAIPKGLFVIKKTRIDAIYTTSGPFISLFIGFVLKCFTKKCWIADLRDPLTFAYAWRWPSFIHYKIVGLIEKALLRKADLIIANTESSRKKYLEFLDIEPQKIEVITNGYDKSLVNTDKTATLSDKFTICYAGTLNSLDIILGKKKGKKFLEYSYDKVDVTTRSGYYLLKALQKSIEEKSIDRNKISINLYGAISKEYTGFIEELGLSDCVKIEGNIEHKEVLKKLARAHMLFLPMESGIDGERSLHIPGKLYEYIAMEKPILMLSDDSDARDILEKCGTGILAPSKNIEKIADILSHSYQKWQNNELSITPDKEYIKLFSRSVLTAKLCKIINRVCSHNNGDCSVS